MLSYWGEERKHYSISRTEVHCFEELRLRALSWWIIRRQALWRLRESEVARSGPATGLYFRRTHKWQPKHRAERNESAINLHGERWSRSRDGVTCVESRPTCTVIGTMSRAEIVRSEKAGNRGRGDNSAEDRYCRTRQSLIRSSKLIMQYNIIASTFALRHRLPHIRTALCPTPTLTYG